MYFSFQNIPAGLLARIYRMNKRSGDGIWAPP